MYETFESLGRQYEENATAGWLFLISLEKLIKDRYECLGKINHCQNTSKNNKKLSDEFDWLQMQVNSLNVYECVLEEELSGSHGACTADQTEAFIIRLSE